LYVVVGWDWRGRNDVVAVVSMKEMICIQEEDGFIYAGERQGTANL
jgi:hypothetical protein